MCMDVWAGWCHMMGATQPTAGPHLWKSDHVSWVKTVPVPLSVCTDMCGAPPDCCALPGPLDPADGTAGAPGGNPIPGACGCAATPKPGCGGGGLQRGLCGGFGSQGAAGPRGAPASKPCLPPGTEAFASVDPGACERRHATSALRKHRSAS